MTIDIFTGQRLGDYWELVIGYDLLEGICQKGVSFFKLIEESKKTSHTPVNHDTAVSLIGGLKLVNSLREQGAYIKFDVFSVLKMETSSVVVLVVYSLEATPFLASFNETGSELFNSRVKFQWVRRERCDFYSAIELRHFKI